MTPYGTSAGGGGVGPEAYNKQAHSFRQVNIDKGTELFLKQLEGDDNKNQGSQPSIKGGLPPHLLRQKNEPPHSITTNSFAASPSCKPQHGTRLPFEEPAAHNYDHVQYMATPSTFSASTNGPIRQQQSGPHKKLPFRPRHPARVAQVLALRRTAPHQAHPTPSPAQYQPRKSVDACAQGTTDISPTFQGLPASRWAGRPSRVHNEQSQSHDDHPALVPTDGVRLSIDTYGDWSPFDGKDGEQQQQKPMDTQEQEQWKIRKWRPKHSCDLESQDLPDSAASSLIFNDSGPNSVCEDGTWGSLDIRNTVGGELDLVPKAHGEGFYNKNQWDDYPDETKALEWRPTYCQLWVKEIENEKWPVAVFLNVEGLADEKCDVQTSNGWLLPPVDYPNTHINPEEAQNTQRDVVLSSQYLRRLNGSATLKMKADYHRRKRRVDEREGEVKWEDPSPVVTPRNQPSGQCTSRPSPAATQSYMNRSPVMGEAPTIHRAERKVQHPVFGEITHVPRTFEAERPPTYLKIACFLRPAEANDLSQLLDIYNWEVCHGMQALDTNPLSLEDMERVFKQCKDAKTPIIVAIAGTPAEANTKREFALATRGRYRGPQLPPQQTEVDKVIGFAFVSIPVPGLAGDTHHNVGRFSGQLHIYVTHKCRHKGIGRALLQRMTIFCSRYAGYYASEYVWHDPKQTPTYDEAAYNWRSYSRVFINFASRGKDDPDTLWMSRFLDTENFVCVSTQDKARKVGFGEDGELVDCLVWQHDCHDLDRIRENGPKLR